MIQPLSTLVFISYSRKDEVIMRRMVAFLRGQGIKVWLDHEKLIPGTPIWEEEIEKAIRGASAVIAVMSPDAKNSEWVRREISLADQNRKQIFPVLVRGDEDSSISLRLITRQYIDLREEEQVGFHSLYVALSNYLNEITAQASENPSLEKATTNRSATNVLADQKVKTKLSAGETVWIPLVWALAGAIGGFMYSEYGAAAGGAIGGAIGSIITAITLRTENGSPVPRNMAWILLAWTISGAISWYIGDTLTEAIGLGIGYTIFAAAVLFATFRLQHIRVNWKGALWILLAWTISGMIGWYIGRSIQQNDILDWATGWALAYALAWAIAGFVTIWQLRKMKT